MDKLMDEIMLRTGCGRMEAREVADELIQSELLKALSQHQYDFALQRVKSSFTKAKV